jgi:hypothetical protein
LRGEAAPEVQRSWELVYGSTADMYELCDGVYVKIAQLGDGDAAAQDPADPDGGSGPSTRRNGVHTDAQVEVGTSSTLTNYDVCQGLWQWEASGDESED